MLCEETKNKSFATSYIALIFSVGFLTNGYVLCYNGMMKVDHIILKIT